MRMKITNQNSGTNIFEIADRIYRISTPLDVVPGGFSFNQYLIVDDQPFLFHTGPRKLFDVIREAVAAVTPPERLRYIAFSHFEADECGSLNEWLATAPESVAVCSKVAAMTSINDVAARPPRVLADGQELDLGEHRLRWFDTPHLPHGWESGLMFDERTRTLLCGDLFTQPGSTLPALTESDILESSEKLRRGLDYFARTPATRSMLDRLASCEPATLACMHGSAWRGDGSALLRALADRLEQQDGSSR